MRHVQKHVLSMLSGSSRCARMASCTENEGAFYKNLHCLPRRTQSYLCDPELSILIVDSQAPPARCGMRRRVLTPWSAPQPKQATPWCTLISVRGPHPWSCVKGISDHLFVRLIKCNFQGSVWLLGCMSLETPMFFPGAHCVSAAAAGLGEEGAVLSISVQFLILSHIKERKI